MRVIWISIAVILLDQLTKLAIQLSHLSESIAFVKGGIALIVRNNTAVTAQQLNAALLNSTSWMLIAGLLALILLSTRLKSLINFTTTRTLVGLQLAAGGLASQVIDYLLRGSAQSSLELHLYESFTLKAGIADLALMSGFLLLIYAFLSGATRIRSKINLLHSTPVKLDFSPIPRGVDNIHIDVQLSPEFCRNAAVLISRVVNNVIEDMKSRKNQQPLPNALFMPLKKSFLTLHLDTVRKAKSSGEPQLIDLLYVSIIKFIHGEVTNCVAARLSQSKENVQAHHKRGIGGRNDSQQVEQLFRHQDPIIAKVSQLILDGLVEGQLVNLDKGIKGFLGKDRSFALDAMRSPLITSNSPESDKIQFHHYMLFGSGEHSMMSFLQIDRVLDDVLRDYLELIQTDNIEESGRSKSREFDSDNTTAELLTRPSVLMHPLNSTILFNQQWTQENIKKAGRKQWRQYNKYRSHLRFQKRLAEQLLYSLKKSGIVPWIVAVYESKALFSKINSDLGPSALVTLLVECKNKKELQQRLDNIARGINVMPKTEQVIKTWESIAKQQDTLLLKHLHAFIGDFSRYRRDLLLLYKYHKASEQVELLQDKKSLHTSRSNFTLYEFLLPTEKSEEKKAIRSHIIIKADLRGSTEVTDKLNQMALNPATHFDRNFFSPINNIIDNFGAEKVFIEGDAIILILNDYVGTKHDHLIASRACALATEILRVVAKQNKELEVYGLPKLELGIGVAYSNESPRFLFDGDHKITISPAINRGDRLSACAWAIKQWRKKLSAPASHVEVYQPSERALGHGEKAQKDMIYNLNGILIEADIFELIKKEVVPKRIINELPHKEDSRLYAIKVPSVEGDLQSLVIRKAPIKVYDPEYGLNECPIVEERFFYEVIHDKKTLDFLRNSNRSRAAAK